MIIVANERPFNIVRIDGSESLSATLPNTLAAAAEDSEGMGPDAVLLIHVAGSIGPSEVRPWPGAVDLTTVSRWERVLRRIERTPTTILAFVEHACTQAALELLAVADRRIASTGFSMVRRAPDEDIWPSMALWRLCRQIGESRTRQLLLDRTVLSAERAFEFGIVDTI